MAKRPPTANASSPHAPAQEGAARTLQCLPNPPPKPPRPSNLNPNNASSQGGTVQQTRKLAAARKRASAIFLPPEIWRLIGEKITARGTLASLIGVSRAFRDMFTPPLYKCRIVNLERFPSSRPVNETSIPPCLQYVHDFHVNLKQFRTRYQSVGNEYRQEKNDEFAMWIKRALESMTCLHSFKWLDAAFEGKYATALILRNRDLLRTLKSIPTLRCIFFQFSSHFIEDNIAVRRCYVPLSGFRNLTSLELYDFYGKLKPLIKDIGRVLCDSPTLKNLGLGLASACDENGETIFIGGQDFQADFLECLCEFYGSKCKHGPLAIETLRLGYGIYLNKPSTSNSPTHYLTKLLTARSLRVLHLFNGEVITDDANDYLFPVTDWTPFIADKCPLLYQLSVTRLEDDVSDWLRHESSNCVRELIVTDHYSCNEAGLKQFKNLPSHITMLSTRERYDDGGGRSETDPTDSGWTDIDTDAEETDADFTLVDSVIPEPADTEPSISQPSHSYPSHIERLLNNSDITVLDRLPDGGSHLIRLSMCLDFETQWLQFASHLGKLTCLTQLCLQAKSRRRGNYPTLKSSLWLDARETSEIARRYAHLIGSMCPALRYIKIGHDWGWEISRQSAAHVGIRTRSRSSISLRELDFDEMVNIELFEISYFAEQCGLPGPPRERKESDEDKDKSIKELKAMLEQRGLPTFAL